MVMPRPISFMFGEMPRRGRGIEGDIPKVMLREKEDENQPKTYKKNKRRRNTRWFCQLEVSWSRKMAV